MGDNAPILVKCACQHCGNYIEFEPDQLTAENNVVQCPHCAQATALSAPEFRPSSAIPPLLSPRLPRAPKLGKSTALKYFAFAGVGTVVILLLSIILILLTRNDRLTYALGGANPTDQTQQQRVWSSAINKVMKNWESARKKSEIQDASAPDTLERLRAFVSHVNSIDISECPTDFKEAYVRHVNAWDSLVNELSRQPQSFADGFIQGALNGLGGEADGGYSRWNKARQQRVDVVESTGHELMAVSARY